MKKIIKYLKYYWPVIFILLTISLLFITNFSPKTYLIGWDNLQTELGNKINLQRSIFSVWEQYQGLGLLAGNAHAADMVRQLIVSSISLLTPLNQNRQIYIFLMLGIGTFGAYFLLKKLFFENKDDFISKTLSLTGGLFYLFNLSTIQTFYAPFEPFVTHFAFLPWLILSCVMYLKKSSRKNLAFLILINILAVSQFQVPTMFLVYSLILFTILITYFVKEKTIQIRNNSLKIILITLIINAFWLLPFLYFLTANSSVALSAKINQMSTETVYLQNKAFGNLTDVILLKGFWFNNVDPNLKGVTTYMLEPWREHFSNVFINIIGYLFFIPILIGLVYSLKKRVSFNIAFAILFIGSFTLLALNTFPFSVVDLFFSKIPLIHEVFRFPFTKFSIILSLCYSIFFVLGINVLLSYIGKFIKYLNLNAAFACIISLLLLIIFTLPVFSGNLFYSKEKINLPKEYSQVFDFFNKQNPNTRIANLPQPTFWGWEFYSWGYGGSGFLWYGIKQPVLDRAFDVWSKYDENYYWELSQAINLDDPAAFLNVLNKYQINWLLMDKNLIYPSSPISLLTQRTYSLINQNSSIQKVVSFGNIDIFKVSLKDNPKNFVFSSALNTANAYNWSNFDRAYTDLGNYQEGNANFYPFRSLFSNKNQDNLEYKMTDEEKDILLTNPLPAQNLNSNLILPPFPKSEQIIPANLVIKLTQNGIYLNAILKAPEISILSGGHKNIIYSNSQELPVSKIPAAGNIQVSVNGTTTYNFTANSPQDLGTTFFSTVQDNIIVVKTTSGSEIFTIKKDQISSLFSSSEIHLPKIESGSEIQIRIPKINDGYLNYNHKPNTETAKSVKNCDNFNNKHYLAKISKINNQDFLELESEYATACFDISIPNLIHNLAYAVFANSINQSGRSLHFWLFNPNNYSTPIDTYLNTGNSIKTNSLILSPQEEFGRSYSLHFENISINNDLTINKLGNVDIFPIPYNFLTSAIIESNQTTNPNNALFKSVLHSNESLYEVTNITAGKDSPIILSQSFDPGWKAYEIDKLSLLNQVFPFIFGKEIKRHVMINNWENGWILTGKEANNIVLVYIPQYFEYLGFFTLVITISVILIDYLASKFTQKRPFRLD